MASRLAAWAFEAQFVNRRSGRRTVTHSYVTTSFSRRPSRSLGRRGRGVLVKGTFLGRRVAVPFLRGREGRGGEVRCHRKFFFGLSELGCGSLGAFASFFI